MAMRHMQCFEPEDSRVAILGTLRGGLCGVNPGRDPFWARPLGIKSSWRHGGIEEEEVRDQDCVQRSYSVPAPRCRQMRMLVIDAPHNLDFLVTEICYNIFLGAKGFRRNGSMERNANSGPMRACDAAV